MESVIRSEKMELLDMGVPHQDIVPAFHHPGMRPLTQFAAA